GAYSFDGLAPRAHFVSSGLVSCPRVTRAHFTRGGHDHELTVNRRQRRVETKVVLQGGDSVGKSGHVHQYSEGAAHSGTDRGDAIPDRLIVGLQRITVDQW